MTELVNDIKRGEIANCITLHDFAIEKIDLKAWSDYVISFFKQHGIVPTRISSPAANSAKNISFERGIKNHEKINFQVDDIWIGALPPDHNSDIFCSIFTAKISLNEFRKYTSLIFDNEIVKFDISIIQQLVKDLVKITGARYGYVYQRPFLQTVGYERGVISGLKFSDPEGDFIMLWGDVIDKRFKGTYKTGDLRDIYPGNILSSAHLERVIDGQKLPDWIAASPNRGVLQQLDQDVWFWQVEFDQISNVREEIRSSGIVLCI